MTLDVVAAWQNSRSTVGDLQQDQETAEVEEEEEQQGPVDLTEDSTQDSQPPRPAKRRKITHGPNPVAEEETPEKKPRKVGTAESARFQSVSQDLVAQEERPNEIKDSYEDDLQLSSAGVVKATVEISVEDGFDRDAYSKVVTSSQLSQPSLPPQSSVDLSSSQLQTPAPRHKYSSSIWDEDIEGIPDSQEPSASSSYKPSETQAANTVSTSPDSIEVHTNTDPDASGFDNTQVTSGDQFSTSESGDSGLAQPFDTQASYKGQATQSSSTQTQSSALPSSDQQQLLSCTQESQGRWQDSGHPNQATLSPDSPELPPAEPPSPGLQTSPSSQAQTGFARISQDEQRSEDSSPTSDERGPRQRSVTELQIEQPSSQNLPASTDPSLPLHEARLEHSLLSESSRPHISSPASQPNLQSAQVLSRFENISEESESAQLYSGRGQAVVSEAVPSSSIEFATQIPLERVEDERDHYLPSSPFIRSSSLSSPSRPAPSAVVLDR